MYCEVYIDVMFLANFMMDSLVLLSVKGLMKKQGNTGRVFVAGAFGAGISCVLMTWLPMGWSQFLVLHLLAGPAMLWIGIQLDGLSEFLRAYFLLYFVSILFGGVLGMLKPYVKSGSLYLNSSSLLLWDSNYLEFSVKVAGISAEYLLCHVIYRKEILYCAAHFGIRGMF